MTTEENTPLEIFGFILEFINFQIQIRYLSGVSLCFNRYLSPKSLVNSFNCNTFNLKHSLTFC